MAQLIRVDFTARTFIHDSPRPTDDDVAVATAELLREVAAKSASAPARGPEPVVADTRCPVCQSAACAVWRAVRGTHVAPVT